MTTMVLEKLKTSATFTATWKLVGPNAPSAPRAVMKPAPMSVITSTWALAVSQTALSVRAFRSRRRPMAKSMRVTPISAKRSRDSTCSTPAAWRAKPAARKPIRGGSRTAQAMSPHTKTTPR